MIRILLQSKLDMLCDYFFLYQHRKYNLKKTIYCSWKEKKITFTSTIGKRYVDLILGSPVLLNNSKYNKNTISLTGLCIIGIIYGLGMGLVFSGRFGWITQNQGTLYVFMLYCSIPVLLPVIYFMRNPKHLKTVLQDHKLTWFVKRRKFEE